MIQLTTRIFLFFTLIVFSSFGQGGSTTGGHFVNNNVDSIPTYIDGEFGFVDYLTRNFRVSQSIKTNSRSNQSVLISFDVAMDGTTSNVQVEHAENAYIANEFKRLCTNMEGWSPATLYNSPVNSRIYIPFSFTIEADQIIYRPDNDLLITKNGEKKATVLKTVLFAAASIPITALTTTVIYIQKKKN